VAIGQRTLSAAAVASITEEATDEVWLVLVKVTHADLTDAIRVVNNIEHLTSNGEVYLACPFDLELPDEGDRPGEARIRIDNVSRDITRALRSISSAPTVRLQVILASQPDTIEMSVEGLTLRDAIYELDYITGSLRFDDITIEAVAELITPDRFPGLF